MKDETLHMLEPLNDYCSTMFLGGSRRFGYNRINSDWDVFCLATVELQEKMALDLCLVASKIYKVPTFNQYRGFSYGRSIDINVTNSGATYKILHDQHKDLEGFLLLDYNKHLLHFIETLRKHSTCRGSHIYKALVHIMKHGG